MPYQCVLATGDGTSDRYEALEAECVPIVERTHAELYHEALFTDNFPSAPAPSKRLRPVRSHAPCCKRTRMATSAVSFRF